MLRIRAAGVRRRVGAVAPLVARRVSREVGGSVADVRVSLRHDSDARRRSSQHQHLRAERNARRRCRSSSRERRTASPATRSFGGDYRFLAADGYVFVYQDIRGRYGSEGQFYMNRPLHSADAIRRARTRAPTRTTRSRGCSRTCRTTTRASACSASRIPGFSRRWPASTRTRR